MPNLIQEHSFPQCVYFEKHGFAAARGNGGQKQVFPFPYQGNIHAQAVAAQHAVSLKHPDGASYAVAIIIRAVLRLAEMLPFNMPLSICLIFNKVINKMTSY